MNSMLLLLLLPVLFTSSVWTESIVKEEKYHYLPPSVPTSPLFPAVPQSPGHSIPPGPPSLPPKFPNDVPSCPVRTFFVTITSTVVEHLTVYNTRTQFVPSTVQQDITESHLLTSTLEFTHTLTKHPRPVIITDTQLVTATKYQTQIQPWTETVYLTNTQTRKLTETSVETERSTRTITVNSFTTLTTTLTSTGTAQATDFVVTTHRQFFTKTQHLPRFVTHTLTSKYKVYETITETRTQHEYITETTLSFSTLFTTICSPHVNPATHHHGSYGSYH
ncbi:hypothetical protein SK128_009247 [Halocaridina rubra]|uniref:Uncharacterized protein n=1 Tax=Halocaridina rubra TaxID=373956 RepID=A0AAN8WYN5_HALRR